MLDSVDKFLHYLAECSNGSESSSSQPTPSQKMPQETILNSSLERAFADNEEAEIKEECIDEFAVSGQKASPKTTENNETHVSKFGAELSELTDLIEPDVGSSGFHNGKSKLNTVSSMVSLKSELMNSPDNGPLHSDALVFDQKRGIAHAEAGSNSPRHTNCSLLDVFVKEEFVNESASEHCSSNSVQTDESSSKLNEFLRKNSSKSVDLIMMMKIISNKLVDAGTSFDMKTSLIEALENVLESFLADCKHLASEPSFIEVIIKLFEEALKFKENIPFNIKSEMMDLISDFLLPVFELPETESESDTMLDEVSRMGFHQRIKEIAEKHSHGMLKEYTKLPDDFCIISNEHDDVESINKLFSKRFPSLYDKQHKDQDKHLDTLGTNLVSDDLKIIAQSKIPDQQIPMQKEVKSRSNRSRKPSKTSKVRRSDIHAASTSAEASVSSMSNASSSVEESQSSSNGSSSEQTQQDNLPSSKQCDSPGCISQVTCQDPHTKCVVHASCTKMLVFVPCNLCYMLFNNLLSNEPIWKDIFTFRFNQFKCFRKMNGNRVDIAYINKHVEHQFEIFDASLNFDEETVQTRLQESQANKYDATVDWLETDIVGAAKDNKVVGISSRNPETQQKKTSSNLKKVPGPSPLQLLLTQMSSVTSTNLKRKHCDSEQNSSESKTKRKNFKGKSRDDSPASNSSIELSSCDTMSAENSCSSVSSSVDQCAPHAKAAPAGVDAAPSVESTSSSRLAPDDERESSSGEEQFFQQQQHAILATMFMAHPSTWDAFLLASTVLPWANAPKTKEHRATARRAFDEYADCMKDGRYGQAVQEADVFLQHYPSWEPAFVMLAVGLIRLGLRGRALFVCNKAITTLPGAALMMQRLKDSLSSTTNSNLVTPLAAPTLLDESASLGSRAFFQTRLKELLLEKSSRPEPSARPSSLRRSSAEFSVLDLPPESGSSVRGEGSSASAGELSMGSASSQFAGSLGVSSRPPPLYEVAGSSRSGGGGEGRHVESRFDDRRVRPTGEAVASASKNRSRRTGEIPSDVIAAYMRKSSTITEELSEQQLKDESSGLINDEQLLSLSVRQLNKLFAGLPPFLIRVLKQRRRTLKNRGYAYSCRLKRKTFSETLEYQCKKLKDSLNEVVEENQYLRSTNKIFKNGFLDLMEKLRTYEPDYQPHWELSWLLKKPERPPSLMPADSFRSQSSAEAAGNNTAEEDSGDESMWTS